MDDLIEEIKNPKRKQTPKEQKVFLKKLDLNVLLKQYADDALTKWKDPFTRPGAVAVLEGEINGKIFQAVQYSKVGLIPSELLKIYHPLVKEWIEKVPKEIRFKGTRGKCGENFTISTWLYEVERIKGIKQGTISLNEAKKAFKGVVSKAKRIQNKKTDNLIQSLDKKACNHCNPMLEYFGIDEIF